MTPYAILGQKIKLTPEQEQEVVRLKELFYGPGNPGAGSNLFWDRLRCYLASQGLIKLEKGHET